MTRILDFSLGPVQGFVSQARRTRDLWAGSFLLSWLSGRAMRALEEHGKVLFPAVGDDALYRALAEGGRGPRTGSLPNRFKARIDSDADVGALCRKAVQDAWRDLSELVWTRFVSEAAQNGNRTREIWDLQIANFWEVMWTLQDEAGYVSSALDARKNWRSHSAPDEPFGSDHCMLMPDWQELSGYAGARRGERQKQLAFWKAVGGAVSYGLYGDESKSTLELRETERLCAMALVKRLFPVLFDMDSARDEVAKIIGFEPGDVSGRPLRNWRSTAHIAASPWMIGVASAKKEAAAYARSLHSLAKEHSAKGVLLSEPVDVVRALKDNPLERVDGRLFYRDAILNRRADSWGAPVSERPEIRRDLAQMLEPVTKAHGSPSRFYAVLVMDGDHLGTHLSKDPTTNGPKISQRLSTFTKKVVDYSDSANHILIYAGGDDVLGLFPLPDALPAAKTIRSFYQQSFSGSCINATLSGAIVFAPYDAPLSRSIAEAHALLDDVAKEQNGRDSLAIAVSKSAGGGTGWVAKWGENCANVAAFDNLISRIGQADLSSSNLFKLRRYYGEGFNNYDVAEFDATLQAILLAELLVGKDATKECIRKSAEESVKALMSTCVVLRDSKRTFDVDAALAARFLAAESGAGEAKP